MQSATIFLYTDFGAADIYIGQVKAALLRTAPASAVIDLFNDAPAFDVAASAHLLAALSVQLPEDAVTVAIVDPGVGSSRDPVACEIDARWYVGPDNGLLSVLSGRSSARRVYSLSSLPEPASASFHGRDLFAPAAAALATRALDPKTLHAKTRLDVLLDCGDLERIVHVDRYGNALTGVRAANAHGARLQVKGRLLGQARVFSDVPAREQFWYENSLGLAEIAANQASAAAALGLKVGDPVSFVRN
jgi:S-adenosylmethionine hydrolase